MQRIYLDYAATTPLDPAVRRAMEPYLSGPASTGFGNPSSLHFFGQKAITAVDQARERLARAIGADFREILFTGSATEANNLALRGTLKAVLQNAKIKNQNGKAKFKNFRPQVIISSVEHESIRETAWDLEKEGVDVVEIPVSREGIVDLKKIEESLNERTVLVSIMYANNEIGTVQPISTIGRVIADFRSWKSQIPNPPSANPPAGSRAGRRVDTSQKNYSIIPGYYPLFHTDAVQAFQFLDCSREGLGVDLMTFSSHKIYGPKGIGSLYVKGGHGSNAESNFYPAASIITGGGQEFGLRSGTENVAGIVGFAEAVRRVSASRAREGARLVKLCNALWNGIRKNYPHAKLHGISEGRFTPHSSLALPNILSVHFPNLSAEELLVRLDTLGISASAGPACSSRSLEASRVLHALGATPSEARETVRFSLGRYTTPRDIARATSLLRRALTG